MDPATLATTAVTLLAPYFAKMAEGAVSKAGENLSDAVSQGLGRLYRAIKERFAGDAYNEAILRGAEQQPESAPRLGALEGTLGELLEKDQEFASALADLLREAQGDQALHVTESGAVAGGDISMRGTYVAGRDLHIGPQQGQTDAR